LNFEKENGKIFLLALLRKRVKNIERSEGRMGNMARKLQENKEEMIERCIDWRE